MKLKFILICVAILLFVGNYQICELFYYDNIPKWWGLKQNIYNIIIAIAACLSLGSLDNKWYNFLASVFIGLCISNCIDRIFFNVNYFQLNDYLMILITLVTSYIKYVRQRC